jgi:TetR/AcrR family transcriptional regulator
VTQPIQSPPRKTASADPAGRARILAVALRSFAEHGYEGTTTAGVARDAGVTQPLVHHHFGSKEGLWRAAMDELFSELRMFTRLDPDLPPTEAVLGVVERFVRLSAARPELSRILAREGSQPGPRLTYLLDHHIGAQLREIVAVLRSEQRAGVLDPTLRPELLLFFVTGAASRLFDVAALARQGLGVDASEPDTVEAFVAMFRSVLERGVVRKEGDKK